MTMQNPRYRSDLIEFAIAQEVIPGRAPTLPSWKQVGLITGGVQLPDPTFEWEPFYGVGVSNRNMLFPIQGRHQFQGSIPSVYMTHVEARYLLGLAMGLTFRISNLANGTDAGVNVDVGADAVDETGIDGSGFGTGGNWARLGATLPAINIALVPTGTDIADWIIVPDDLDGIYVNSWGYVKGDVTATRINVSRTRDVSVGQNGWNGKAPIGARSFKIYGISGDYVDYSTSGSKTIGVRQSIVQPTFMLGTKWTTDTGQSFTRNYTGCKINRLSISMEEGRPITMSVDFMGTGMRHDLGSSNVPVPRYSAIGVSPDSDTVQQTRAIVWNPINSQPYFFSTVDLRFLGVPFARMRSFTIDIDNQLDPQFYIHDGDGSVTDARQSPVEVLEGRRNITLRGQVDADSTSTTDAQFLQHLLQQGRNRGTDNPLVGLSVEATMQVRTAEGAGTKNSLTIALPGSLGQGARPVGASLSSGFQTGDDYATDTGLIIRSAPHNIPAPPGVNVPIDFEGMSSSVRMTIGDNVNV